MLIATLVSMTVTALVLMLAFPETPTGKWLHRILVETPARILVDLTWVKIGKALLVSVAVVLFAFASPEMLSVVVAMGMDAAAIELLIVVWFASVSGGIGAVWRTIMRVATKSAQLIRAIAAPRNRQRSSSSRKVRPQRKNDDQPEPGWAFA